MKRLVHSLFTALAGLMLWVSAGAQAQSVAITHCQGECPAYGSGTGTRGKLVIHHLYAAGLNGNTGLADWVAYELTAAASGPASLLEREWQTDPLVGVSSLDSAVSLGDSETTLAEISSGASPYAGIVEPQTRQPDRARLAPITSFAKTPYWSELNNLSNMVVMPQPLRRGPWLQLEQALNTAVNAGESVRVIAGPLYLVSQPLSRSPNAVNQMPAAFYKIVADKTGMAAFVFPAKLSQCANFCEQVGSLRDIEQMSGYVMFPDSNLRESSALLGRLGCNPGG